MAERFMPTPEMVAGAQDVSPVTPPQGRFVPTPEMLQNAVPLEPRRQHTYRESTGTVVDAPYGMTPEEIEYHDDTQNIDLLTKLGGTNKAASIRTALYHLESKTIFGNLKGEDEQRYQELAQRPELNMQYKPNNVFEEALLGVAGSAPSMGEYIKGGIQGSAVGAAAGAAIGSVVPGPGTVAGAGTGATFGGKIGMAQKAFEQQAGEVAYNLKQVKGKNGEKLNPNVVRGAAFVAGSVNAGLDLAGPAAFLRHIPGVQGVANQVFKDIVPSLNKIPGFDKIAAPFTKEGMKKVLQLPGAQRIFFNMGKRIAEVAAVEGATEGAQQAVQIGAQESAKGLSDGEFQEFDFDQAAEEVGQAARAGALTGGAVGSVAAGVNVPGDIKEQANAVSAGLTSETNTMTPRDVERAATPVDHSLHIPEAFREFAKGYEPTTGGVRKAALDYVKEKQSETGNEHVLSIGSNGAVLDIVSGIKDKVDIPSHVVKTIDNPEERVTITHSHPEPIGLSPTDMGALARLGLGSIEAVTPDGHSSEASLTDNARSSLIKLDYAERKKVISDISKSAWLAARDTLDKYARDGGGSFKTEEDLLRFRQAHNYVFNKALEEAGLIDYKYTDSHFDVVPEDVTQKAIGEVSSMIKEGMSVYGIEGRGRETRNSATAAGSAGRLVRGETGVDSSGSGSVPPDWYDQVAATPPPSPPSSIASTLADTSSAASDVFVPISTRLGNIHESLKHAVRRFLFDTAVHTHEDQVQVTPFLTVITKKMSNPDYRVLDLALKNGDFAKADEMMVKYGTQKAWSDVRQLLSDIHKQAQESGMEVGFLENYFPRSVQKGMAPEYIAYLKGQETWTHIQQAIDKEDPNHTMTDDERAEIANLWLRGYRNDNLNAGNPGNIKARSIDRVTPDAQQFYKGSAQALIDYVGGMRKAIETRKLLGQTDSEVDKSIGDYVLKLVDEGVIKPKDELQLRQLLKGVLNPKGTSGLINSLKNFTYVYTMGSPISAVTQIGDLSFSLWKNGYYQTGKSLLASVAGREKITREDIGISDIIAEFQDSTLSGKAVRGVFKAVGLEWADKIGKETFVNASLARLKKEATKAKPEFTERMQLIFGDESSQVIQDLQSGRLTENVRYLAYSELADVQPISIAEMPLAYANSGNGRIFYMLKSYTVKQLDVYRRNIFDKLTSGNLKTQAQGIKNLVSLGSALMLTGMASDVLKDFLLGRETDADDLFMDNLLKIMGFSKYQIYKSRKDGFLTAFYNSLFVPKDPLEEIGSDVLDVINDEKDINELKSIKGIPFVGKFYFWWLGAGEDM